MFGLKKLVLLLSLFVSTIAFAGQNVTGNLLVSGNTGLGTNSANNGVLLVSSTNPFDLFRVEDNGTGDSTPFVISSTGNVGIGTITTSGALLTVGATGGFNLSGGGSITRLNGTAITLNNQGATLSTNGAVAFANVNTGSGASVIVTGGAHASSNVEIRATSAVGAGSEYIKMTVGNNGATEAMRILGNGNVGIGSAIPISKLDVNGAIRSSTGTSGQATCWKSDLTLGQCTTSIGIGGSCTCS